MTNGDAVDDIRGQLAELYPGLDTSAFGMVGRILRQARMIEEWRSAHLSEYDLTSAGDA